MKDRFYEEPERVFSAFPKYRTKILLGDFNARICREHIVTQSYWVFGVGPSPGVLETVRYYVSGTGSVSVLR
jgi:hypothetical protein